MRQRIGVTSLDALKCGAQGEFSERDEGRLAGALGRGSALKAADAREAMGAGDRKV